MTNEIEIDAKFIKRLKHLKNNTKHFGQVIDINNGHRLAYS